MVPFAPLAPLAPVYPVTEPEIVHDDAVQDGDCAPASLVSVAEKIAARAIIDDDERREKLLI